jgi:integrase
MEEVRRYLVGMTEREELSTSTVNQAIYGLRFLYAEVLGREWSLGFRLQKRRRTPLRRVLSREEVRRVIDALPSMKLQTIAMTMYGGGLRLQEALGLRVSDIDSGRHRIVVREAKGGREREVMLADRLLEQLRRYYVSERPKDVLFPGKDGRRPLVPSTVQRSIRRAGLAARVRRPVTPHVLRHSFATHLIESGASLPLVQQLLGHKSVKTTMLYTQVSDSAATELISPLDRLG